MTSRLPTNALSAVPPPSVLPSVVMSGVTPYCAWAPPTSVRNPDRTSSKISTAPCRAVSSRAASR